MGEIDEFVSGLHSFKHEDMHTIAVMTKYFARRTFEKMDDCQVNLATEQLQQFQRAIASLRSLRTELLQQFRELPAKSLATSNGEPDHVEERREAEAQRRVRFETAESSISSLSSFTSSKNACSGEGRVEARAERKSEVQSTSEEGISDHS